MLRHTGEKVARIRCSMRNRPRSSIRKYSSRRNTVRDIKPQPDATRLHNNLPSGSLLGHLLRAGIRCVLLLPRENGSDESGLIHIPKPALRHDLVSCNTQRTIDHHVPSWPGVHAWRNLLDSKEPCAVTTGSPNLCRTCDACDFREQQTTSSHSTEYHQQ